MATFTVIEVDYDVGVCKVCIDLPNGEQDIIPIDPYSICASDDATEAQLRDAISQLVEIRMQQLFPPPAPHPQALLDMIGKSYSSGA